MSIQVKLISHRLIMSNMLISNTTMARLNSSTLPHDMVINIDIRIVSNLKLTTDSPTYYRCNP